MLIPSTTTPTAGAVDNLTIKAEDQYGNVITGYTGSHTLSFTGASAIGSNTPTVTNSSGTAIVFSSTPNTAITFTNGVATVSGSSNGQMVLYQVGTPSIVVSDGTYTNGTGVSVTVSPAAENKLAITTQPASSITAGGTVTVGVTIEDTYGNTITTGTTGSTDTLAVALNGASFAAGTTSHAATNGTYSFTGLQINTAGTFTITASDTTDTLVTSTNTNSFTVSPAAENKLAITTQPASSITAGGTVTVGVTIEDTYGNTITTGATGSTDTLAVALNGASFAAGTTSHAATNGTYSFTGLQINTAGSFTITASDTTHGAVTSANTNSFTVNPATQSQLVLIPSTTTPTAGAVDNLTIKAEDQYGNVITGYTGSHTLSFTGASAIGSNTPTVTNSSGTAIVFSSTPNTAITFTNGVATVSGSSNGQMVLYQVGTPSIVVSDGTYTNGTGVSVTVSPAAENKLAITTQPASSITAGGTVTVGVTIEDAYGNTITTGNTGSTDTLAVALNGGSFAAGTASHAASNGTYSFTGLQINTAGSFTITASDTTHSAVTSANTNSFTVNPAAASQVVWLTQPTTSTAGSMSPVRQPSKSWTPTATR